MMDRAPPGNRRAGLADVAGFFTDFADQAVVLPVCVCTVVGLAVAGWRRGALAFGFASAGVLAAMLLLKLLAAGCGIFRPWANITSPSGHTAAAAMVYGGFIALVLRRFLSPWRAALLACLPVAVAIGATRLALQVHTPAEVTLASLVGLTGVVCLVFLAGKPPTGLRPWRVGVAGLAIMLLLHGIRLPAEQQIRWASLHMWPFSTCHAAL
jgi:membrane-associated phospholipid phosphatase